MLCVFSIIFCDLKYFDFFIKFFYFFIIKYILTKIILIVSGCTKRLFMYVDFVKNAGDIPGTVFCLWRGVGVAITSEGVEVCKKWNKIMLEWKNVTQP